MSGKITPIYHYRYISQILLFFDNTVILPFSIFLGYCLQQKEATFVYVPAYTQLVTVIAVVFFLRPNPLYHSLVPVAVSLLEKRTVECQEGRSGSRLAGRSPNRYPDSGRACLDPR